MDEEMCLLLLQRMLSLRYLVRKSQCQYGEIKERDMGGCSIVWAQRV